MTTIQIIAWVIITILCFILAPFFTIGTIFFLAEMEWLSFIFMILGMLNMIRRVRNILEY